MARRNNVDARGRAEWGRGVRLKWGLAGGTRNAVMLRDEVCFLAVHANTCVTLLRSGRNGRMGGRMFEREGKMCRGIEKGTKTLK
jgi:hypothetical protein